MEDIEQMSQKMLHLKNQKSNIRNNNKSPSIDQEQDTNGLTIT